MTTAAQSDSIKSGIDLTHLDPATRPQDDLFVHVNGRWLTDHEIPADRAVDGAFRTLYDRAEVDVRSIIESAADADAEPGSITRKIGDLYASFMDTDAVAAAGLAPLEQELAQVRAVADRDELAALLGRLQRVGVGGLVGNFVDTDAKDSERYLVHLNQSGLGLPDESYYREDTYAPIREKYVAHVAAMLTLAGFDDVEALAQRIFELETALAAAHWDVVRNRDADLTYNLHTLADLDTLAPGFPWRAWALALGGTEESFHEVVARQPGFLTGAAQLWSERGLDEWKAWLSWRVIRSRAPYLTDELVQENFEFYGKTLTGTEELRDRWKRGVSLVEDLLGEAVGKLYVEQHFPESSKARMEELVANLIEAYRRNISVLEWMSPATREAALRKLDKFTPKIGYPAKWRDYSAVQVTRGDLVANYRSGYAAEHDRDLAKLGGPVDRDEWFMTPQTVNAYYNPGMNEIVFPAAILQPPFFDPDADDAANYGGIGAVIGHEIGHGFDDQGAKYDGDGNMVDWWSDDDRAEFGKRTRALIEQYGQFSPKGLDGHKVNGELTIGENIGDLGGLSIALAAYRIATDGAEPPAIDGLTGIQRVFFGWAQVWRTKARESEAIRRLAIDPHSPPEFRCNGVIRNVDDFHAAFDVAAGDALYLDPAERVRIW
ncbi:peptidase M13 [Rhodococcus sp. D2-41]|uniref:M13 family metallopeptidase n=1 Tax=Speluncibacter jeojiensis TaxID=2710754 RepID=A0A9X4LXA5_9ACTN|nr:M13 family metallopeptidase [Rhodococcus sp. D2-41]MDG3010362.1 peptidase M13 [Rhodococcus sp. D2-41]MDG3014098.1 M13 family metallopeptidase [Corynebacteriales bacterium D3-21]